MVEDDLSPEQIESLEEHLGINIGASHEIANDLLDYFVERCQEEDIGHHIHFMVAQAFADRVKDAYAVASVPE